MAQWEDELAELADARGRALVGYAYVLCGDQRFAEDLVQDALVKVFSRLRRTQRDASAQGVHPLDGGGRVTESYVRRAILTLYLDEYRRRKRWTGVRHLVAAEDEVRGPASGATARADVAAALGRLAPRERACVVLRYFEDLTVPQVAAELGLAQGTVKRYLADATTALRGVLQVPVDPLPGATAEGNSGHDDGQEGRTMNTDRARDDWADAGTDGMLRRELGALAGSGAASSTLDARLPTVRSRVRRRRTTKQAGIGATALAVVAALAVGGTSLLPDQPRPLPGPAGTPTPAPSSPPTGTPTDATTEGTALGMVEDGYQPTWLAGTALECGMAVTDLPRNPDGVTLDLVTDPVLEDDTSADGTETAQYWRATTRLDVPDPVDAGHRATLPTFLWVQDGSVVDVGINTTEAGMDQVGDAPARRTAEDSSLMSCAPEHGGEGDADTFASELPAGEYEVRAFTTLWSPDLSDVELVASDPVTVVLGGATANAAGASRDPAGAKCSAAGLAPGTPDWSELPAPVRSMAQQMLDAALACDDEKLIELAHTYPKATNPNWGGMSARELLELPGAEQDEDVYAILVGLLSGTRPCAAVLGLGDDQPTPVGWPAVAEDVPCDATADDWQDAVDVGAITADESTAMQDPESGRYTGWRLVITADGEWQQLVDGSWEDIRGF